MEDKLRNPELIILGIYIFTIMIIMSSIVIYAIMENNAYNKECLEKIGKKLCEEMGQEFHYSFSSNKPNFYCKENIRLRENIKYHFLEEDVKECKN